MKKFKQFINTIKKQPPIIPAVIHFKHVQAKVPKAQTPFPIHFRHVKEDTQLDKPIVGHIDDWHAINDNAHLSNQKPDTDAHNEEIANKVIKDKPLSDLPDEDRDYINRYTAEYSDGLPSHLNKMTSHLINGRILSNAKLTKQHQDAISSLDNSINNNRIQRPLSLYSGVGFDPEKHIDENGQMFSPAFISATHSKNTAINFSSRYVRDAKPIENPDNYSIDHIIHFHLNPNDAAMHVSHLSDVPEEYETIIGRGQTLQHHGTSSYEDPLYKKIYRIHHMSIVPPQGK